MLELEIKSQTKKAEMVRIILKITLNHNFDQLFGLSFHSIHFNIFISLINSEFAFKYFVISLIFPTASGHFYCTPIFNIFIFFYCTLSMYSFCFSTFWSFSRNKFHIKQKNIDFDSTEQLHSWEHGHNIIQHYFWNCT